MIGQWVCKLNWVGQLFSADRECLTSADIAKLSGSVTRFSAIFRNEIMTILTPSTSEGGEWGWCGWSLFSFWGSLITNPQCYFIYIYIYIYIYTSLWRRAFGVPRGSAPMARYYDSQLRSSLRSLLACRAFSTPKDNGIDNVNWHISCRFSWMSLNLEFHPSFV